MKDNQKLKSFGLNEKWTLNKVSFDFRRNEFQSFDSYTGKALPIILEGESHS